MTVSELIQVLSNENPDALVFIRLTDFDGQEEMFKLSGNDQFKKVADFGSVENHTMANGNSVVIITQNIIRTRDL